MLAAAAYDNPINRALFDPFNPWESVRVSKGLGMTRVRRLPLTSVPVRAVDHAQIWNGYEAGPSVKRMLVETSSDGTNFAPVGDFTLTTASPASDTIALGHANGRYVRFTILENGSGQLFPVVGPGTAGTL